MFGSSSNVFGQSSNSSPFGTQTPSVFGQSSNVNSPFGAFGQTNNASSPFGTQTPSVFGQGNNASSPFGTQTPSAFGQSNNAGSPFAARPFGTSTPFGAQTGSSMFGGTSTGVFGATQASSPFGSSPAFGASSAPAFGNSGNSSFAFSTPQSSPFGGNTQQSQSAFGNSLFGASSTPAFGASSTPAFGSTSTNPFGASSTPAFGTSSTSAFGVSSSPAFGVTPAPAFGNNAFGNNAFSSGSAFAASSTPGFGTSTTPSFSFGQSNSAFSSSQSPFGQSNSAFSSTQSPFGQPNSAFSSTQSPFGQSNSAFSSTQSPFGQSNSAFNSTQSPFGAQGAQTSTPFGAQQVGSRVKPYAATPEADQAGSAGKLSSISAMPEYKNKTHEELRWEDYQRGDKGGPSPGGTGFGLSNSQPSLFSPFNQTPANPPNSFSSPTPTNTFTNTNPFSSTTTTNTFPSPFSSTTTTNTFNSPNLFSNPVTTPKFSMPFGQTGTAPSMFNSTSSSATSTFTSLSTPGFSSSSSLFNSNTAPGSNSAFSNSHSSPLFSSNPFGQSNTSTALGQTSTLFPQNTSPAFSQPNNFSTPSTGFANTFLSSPSFTTNNSPFGQTTPAPLTPYQPAQPAQPSGPFSFNNFSQTQPGAMGTFSPNNVGQVPAPANTGVMQQTPVTNPFGTLPALPQISIGQGGNSPSIKYGISSMPVVDKPAPIRTSPLLTSRHLLQRRVKLPARKYRPGDDGPKVAFFSDEENSNTPKADALFIPRENPRALFIRPAEKEKSAPRKDNPTPLQENGKSLNGGTNEANHENKKNSEVRDAPPAKADHKPNGRHEINGGEKNGANNSPSRADIESIMPKLQHSEYFTEPRIQELAAKERVNPGYCKRVRDFVVGRHGYGSIKFLGETDVCKLDLETLVQFNNREVIVYMDESQKPPVGEGLNKSAEVTLLNIKCMDKKSGKQVTEGSRLDKYKEMLKRKAEEQGAQFVSYDAVKGEWKFKVEHFSSYMLGDEDDV